MLKKWAKRLLKLLPMKYILFESKPDYSDNSMALYRYLKENNMLSDYRFLWLSSNPASKGNAIPTFVFDGSPLSRLRRAYYVASSRALIFCNTQIGKLREDQLSLYLCHGSKAKKTRGVYEALKDVDYVLLQAEVFRDALMYEYNLSEHSKLLMLGYPRNDELLHPAADEVRRALDADYQKLIVWYPTFRQQKNENRNVSSISLPVIHDLDAAQRLNDCARENGVLILLKPHFAQDMRLIQQQSFSNLRIISDDFLKEKSLPSYRLLAGSDAMVSDYSSVYYDYLLTDKPIGLAWEDVEEYKQKQGFALDPDLVFSGGEKLYNVEDFCAFIRRIARGEDPLREQRRANRALTNFHQDDQSCRRVAEFVEEQLKKPLISKE